MSEQRRLVNWKMNFFETADSRIIITRQRQGGKLWPTYVNLKLKACSIQWAPGLLIVNWGIDSFYGGWKTNTNAAKLLSFRADRSLLIQFTNDDKVNTGKRPACRVKTSWVIVYRLAPSFSFRKHFYVLLSVRERTAGVEKKFRN